jgi:phospholipid transport system substrate-binding protein
MIFFVANNCFAVQTTDKVKSFIEDICVKAIDIAANKSLNDAEKTIELSDMFVKTVDIKWIGKFVMGRYYRTLSDDQKIQYDTVFSKFLIDSYVPSFKKYTSESVKVVNITNHSDNEYVAQTEIIRPGKESFKVNYMVREIGGAYSIFDVIAEGVSLINTKRAEFEYIISSGDVDHLIKLLQDKIKNN